MVIQGFKATWYLEGHGARTKWVNNGDKGIVIWVIGLITLLAKHP